MQMHAVCTSMEMNFSFLEFYLCMPGSFFFLAKGTNCIVQRSTTRNKSALLQHCPGRPNSG